MDGWTDALLLLSDQTYVLCYCIVMWNITMSFNLFTTRPEPQYWSTVMSFVIMPVGGLGAFAFNSMIGKVYDRFVNHSFIHLSIGWA